MVLRKVVLSLSLVLLASPALAAGRELAPRGGGPTSYNAEGALVAFAGDRFLTVWVESMDNIGTHLKGSFSDASGRKTTDLAFPIMPFAQRPVQLVSTGDAFALFSAGASGEQTHLTEIDLDGRMIRTRALALPHLFDLRAAWNGTRFVVALRPFSGTALPSEAVLLDRDGNITQRTTLGVEAFAFALQPDADGFTLLTTGFRGVYAYRITNGGAMVRTPVELSGDAIQGAITPWLPVIAPLPNGDAIAVWTTGNAQRTEVKSVVIARSGEIHDVRVRHTFDSPSVRALELLRSGDHYTLLYERLLENSAMVLETLTFDAAGARVVARISEATLSPSAAVSGNVLFVAYTPARELPYRVNGVAVAPDGSGGPVQLLSLARTRQTQPALAAGGGRYLAAWTDVTGGAAYVRAASLGLDGVPLTDHIIQPAHLSARELAWNGTHYLAVAQRDGRLLATRVTFDGQPVDAQPSVIADLTGQAWWGVSTSAAWAGDRWMVTWLMYDAIHVATVSRAGIPSTPRKLELETPLPEPDWWRGFLAATVASNGTTTLLVWSEEQRPPCFFPPCGGAESEKTFAVRLAANGDVRDDVPLELPGATSLSLATSGDEFLLLGDTTATVIDASATPHIVTSREIFNWPALGDVTWDGATYAVALRYHAARWRLAVLHLDRNANQVGGGRGVETLPPDQFLAPGIAAIRAGSSLIAVQEGDARDGARAVVYSEDEMTPLPPPPAPPRNVRVTAIGGRFEVTWGPSRGEDVALYRVEYQLESGVWIPLANVAADQPLRAVSMIRNVRVIAVNPAGASEPALPSTTAKRRGARQ